MALNNFKCNHLMALHFKGLKLPFNAVTLFVHDVAQKFSRRSEL